MSPNQTEFWNSDYNNHPPLTNEMVVIAENTLGVKLPTLLLSLLRVQNGGYTKGFAFPMTEKTSWSDNHVPLTELFGIVTDNSISTAQNILDTAYMTEEWGLPAKQVLLSGDGHWWITLDYRQGKEPTVRWLDVDMEQDVLVANSLEEFISGLVPDTTFAE